MLSWPVLCRSVAVEGPRRADDVWNRYVRPGRWPEWSPQIRSVVYAGDTLSPQTTGYVNGPGGLRVRFRILEVSAADPVRHWAWSVRAFGVRLHLRHTVRATATGTRTELIVRGFAPAVVLYLPVARSALRRLVRR
jgi:hypothetical protein